MFAKFVMLLVTRALLAIQVGARLALIIFTYCKDLARVSEIALKLLWEINLLGKMEFVYSVLQTV